MKNLFSTWIGIRKNSTPRIRLRTELMFSDGLVDEVAVLVEQGLRDGVTAPRAIGYAQVLAISTVNTIWPKHSNGRSSGHMTLCSPTTIMVPS